MNIQKIKYNQELINNKIRLQKQLNMVEEEIKIQQESCDHIVVELSCPDYTPFNNFRVCHICVICGKKDVYLIKRLIDAKEYLRSRYNDDTSEKQREEKFKLLQELTWELIEEHPSMTGDELMVKLQEAVEKDREPRQTIELEQKIKKIRF